MPTIPCSVNGIDAVLFALLFMHLVSTPAETFLPYGRTRAFTFQFSIRRWDFRFTTM